MPHGWQADIRFGGRFAVISCAWIWDNWLVEHEFSVTRPAVWAAFTEPEILAEWFGPEGWGVHLDTVDH